MTWRTHEEIDEYWEKEEARIVDAYAEGRIRRATMMGALKKLAQDVTIMHDKLDEPEESDDAEETAESTGYDLR